MDRFPGTISISQETLYRLHRNVFSEAARNGVRHLVAVNGRGGNVHALRMAARDVSKATGLAMVVVNWWVDLAKEVRRRVMETPEGHAAEDETSEVMAAYPHLVKEVPRDADERVEARYAVYGREVYQLTYRKAVQGYASKASREKGEARLRAAVEELVQLIKALKEDKLPLSRVA